MRACNMKVIVFPPDSLEVLELLRFLKTNKIHDIFFVKTINFEKESIEDADYELISILGKKKLQKLL